ncbi:hypothetical protein CAPTEDRAFT_204976, partial [Capitella teleta]
EADVVCAALTVTYDRLPVMDFASLPYYTEHQGFIYKRPDPSAALFGIILRPLKQIVWFCVLASILLIAASLWIIGNAKKDNLFTNKLWCMQYSITTLLQQGSPQIPRSSAGRLLSSFFWLFAISWAAIYSGNLTAFLASSSLSTPFVYLDDVAEQTDYEVGTASGGSPEMFLRSTTREPYQTIAKRVFNSGDRNLYHSDVFYHLERVKEGKYIFIDYYSFLLFNQSCEYAVHKTNLEENFNFGLQKNSALTPLFDNVMISVYETGLVDRLHLQYYPKKQPLLCAQPPPSGSLRMRLHSMTDIVVLIGGSLTLSAVTLVIEFIVYWSKKYHWCIWWSLCK